MEEFNPPWRLGDATFEIKLGAKTTRLIVQRNSMLRMKKFGVASKEITNRARGNIGLQRNLGQTRRLRTEIARLLQMRITNKNREIRDSQKRWWRAQKDIERVLSPDALRRYKSIRKEELNHIWDIEVNRSKDKLASMIRPNRLPTELSGIILGDQELASRFGTPVNKPLILGGIQASDNMKAFLSLPLKYRVFQKPRKDDFKVQVTGRGVRQRWNLRDAKNHPEESQEDFVIRKENTEVERQPLSGKTVNFKNLRSTDFMCNKFINLPKPATPREEILIGAEELVLLDVWDLFMAEQLDDRGNLKGASNLSRSQALGRKEISEGIKSKDWLLYGTDKSGHLVLDTLRNFTDCMSEHFKDEIQSEVHHVRQSESILNNHSRSWVKILNLGSDAGDGQTDRISRVNYQ